VGKYDNYDNAKRIRKAQRKLNRLTRSWFPNQAKIEKAREELDTAKMFSSCQIFKSFNGYAPNKNVMFSDDNQVMWFISSAIRYEDIESCKITEKVINKAHTVTKQRGAVSRAIVGGAIAGDLGAVVGAMSADSTSETTYYQEKNGFFFQVYTKDGLIHYVEIPSNRDFSNKLPPKWLDVKAKIQSIIDGTN
jgi:hypothetical protein